MPTTTMARPIWAGRERWSGRMRAATIARARGLGFPRMVGERSLGRSLDGCLLGGREGLGVVRLLRDLGDLLGVDDLVVLVDDHDGPAEQPGHGAVGDARAVVVAE